MIQTLKNNILFIVAAITLLFAAVAVPITASSVAHAADIQNNLCSGAGDLKVSGGTSNCATVSQGSDNSLNNLITQVINIFSLIVGVVAVIMIIVGGFRYITSGGDSNNVGAAKNTILYAIVGLIIVALAQIIVKFVLGKATTTT